MKKIINSTQENDSAKRKKYFYCTFLGFYRILCIHTQENADVVQKKYI